MLVRNHYYQIHSCSYLERHGVYMYMAARGTRRYQFYALQQQQKIILIDRNFLAGKQIN